MFVPTSRDAPYPEINSQFKHLKSLPRESAKLLLIYYYSLAISPPRNQFATRITVVLVILLIISLTLSITTSAIPPYLIATIRVSLKFKVFKGKFY